MSEPERHGKVKLDSWVPCELHQQVVDYQRTRGMKTLTEAHIDVVKKGLSISIDALNYQKCENRSEMPAHYGKFVHCNRYKRNVTEEQCQGCKQYGIVKVPLITMEKLGEINSKFRLSNQELKNENLRLLKEVQELEPNTKDGLLRTIKEQDMDMRIMTKNYREAQELSVKQSKIIVEIQADKNFLAEALEQVRTENNLLTEALEQVRTENNFSRKATEEPQTMPQSQKVEPNPPILERTTTIKEKFASAPQQRSPFSTQQKTLLPEIILCPDIGETVNVEDTCKKNCQKRTSCDHYEQIIVKKATAKQ